MNKVCLVGRLTADASVTEHGEQKIAKFTVAVDRGLSKEAKEKAKQTADFIRCNAWNAKADLIEKYTHKGDQIGVSGKIQTDTYENTEGQKVNVTFVLVENIDLLSSKREQQNNFSVSEDDLPF